MCAIKNGEECTRGQERERKYVRTCITPFRPILLHMRIFKGIIHHWEGDIQKLEAIGERAAIPCH